MTIELPSLPGVSHSHVDVGGLNMHVAELGSGPPLLLLHGWPQHWWMWHKVKPQLADTYRCIAPDLRGLGWTEARGPYDKRTLAADVVALLDALELRDPVPVIGHDWGAVAAQILATEHASRVSKVLSLSVPATWDTSKDPRRLLGLAHMPFLSAPFAERVVPQLTWQMLKLSGFSREDAEPYLSVIAQPEQRRATVGYYRTFTTRELPATLRAPASRPEIPVRLLGGKHDPVLRWSRGVELVPGAGHFLPEDDPDAVVRAAREFL